MQQPDVVFAVEVAGVDDGLRRHHRNARSSVDVVAEPALIDDPERDEESFRVFRDAVSRGKDPSLRYNGAAALGHPLTVDQSMHDCHERKLTLVRVTAAGHSLRVPGFSATRRKAIHKRILVLGKGAGKDINIFAKSRKDVTRGWNITDEKLILWRSESLRKTAK